MEETLNFAITLILKLKFTLAILTIFRSFAKSSFLLFSVDILMNVIQSLGECAGVKSMLLILYSKFDRTGNIEFNLALLNGTHEKFSEAISFIYFRKR